MLKELEDGSLIANKESILATIAIEEDYQIETNIKVVYKKDSIASRILDWIEANKGKALEGF